MTDENQLQVKAIKASMKASMKVTAMNMAIEMNQKLVDRRQQTPEGVMEDAGAIFQWLTEDMDSDYAIAEGNVVGLHPVN